VKIYISIEQSNKFGSAESLYWGDGDLTIAADTLLASRGASGYDSRHTDYLSPLGSRTICLSRSAQDGPGWFLVESVI
jgi:hypothetical protein